jgi:hypothetical protein
MIALYPDPATMLAAFGISGEEVPFDHEGYSGATMTRIAQGADRYVVKRFSRTVDWVIQMTSDPALREAQIGASAVLAPMAPGLRSPSIAAARDGQGFALLMQDLTGCLLPGQARVADVTADLILRRIAKMHARFWNAPAPEHIEWCGLRERLLMLSEPAAERLQAAGFMLTGGFAAGWEKFHSTAPPRARDLVRTLHRDPQPLVDVCMALPQTLLHNDVKIGNMAIDGETLWLFDWALAGFGPAGVDLGWLLATSSSQLPWSLDETTERYGEHLKRELGGRLDNDGWQQQRAVAHISGLIMFGWKKPDDRAELEWWCDRVIAAANAFRW